MTDSHPVFFICAIAASAAAGYFYGLHQIFTGYRRLPWLLRTGVPRWWSASDLSEFDRYRREMYAAVFIQVLTETGGPNAPHPKSREAFVGLFKLAEHRFQVEARSGKDSPR